MGEISDNARIINMVLLIILGTGLLIVAVRAYMWMRDQKNIKPLDDIDWDKEKEITLLLAAEKKVSRKQNKTDATPDTGGDSK